MTSPRHLVSVEQIGDMLRARIHELCVGPWGLVGRLDGHDFVALNPLRADRRVGSFRVAVTGPYQGLIIDFASGERWSALGFTAALLHGGRMGDALRWSRAWLGIDAADPAALAVTRVATPIPAASAQAVDERAEQVRRRAHALWLSGRAIAGTPAAAYLAARGIDIDRFDYPLGALHFHGAVYCQEVDGALPAMLAAIHAADGRFLAVHRTYLECCRGVWRKAAVAVPKKVMGRFAGGAIRLWAGRRIDPATGEIKKGVALAKAAAGAVEIHVTEGVEDGLSLALACPEWRVAAAVSLSNMTHLRWPPSVSALTLWRDNDLPGSPADVAIGRAALALRHAGYHVAVAQPPKNYKDINDWLLDQQRPREIAHAG